MICVLIRGFSSLNCCVCLFNRVAIFSIFYKRIVAKFVVSVSTNNLNSILLAKMIDLLQLVGLEIDTDTNHKLHEVGAHFQQCPIFAAIHPSWLAIKSPHAPLLHRFRRHRHAVVTP